MEFDKTITEKKTVTKETAIAVMNDFVSIAANARMSFENTVKYEQAEIESRKTVHSFETAEKESFGSLRFAVAQYHILGEKIKKAENRSAFVTGVRSFFGYGEQDKNMLASMKRQREDHNKTIRGSTETTGFSSMTSYMATCVAGKIAPEPALEAEYNRRISGKCPENETMADMRNLKFIGEHRGRVNAIGYQMRSIHDNYISSAEAVISRSKSGIENAGKMIDSCSRIKSALIAGNEDVVKPILSGLAQDVFLPGHYSYRMYASPDDNIAVIDNENNKSGMRFSAWLAEDIKRCDYSYIFVADNKGIVKSLHETAQIPAKHREAVAAANISGPAPK